MQGTQVQSLVLEDSTCLRAIKASLVTQLVKNLPAMRETMVQSLGGEDPLEKGMATQLQACWRTVHGVAKSQT